MRVSSLQKKESDRENDWQGKRKVYKGFVRGLNVLSEMLQGPTGQGYASLAKRVMCS